MKTEGSHVLSQPPSATAPFQHSAVHKAVMNRHNQPRRNTSGPGAKNLRPQQLQNISQPPRSHSMNSTTMSPVAGHSQHGVGKGAPMPDGKGHPRHQPPIQPRTHAPQAPDHPSMPRTGATMQPMTPTTDEGRGSDVGGKSGPQSGFYPPGYQAHLDQLGERKLTFPTMNVQANWQQSENTMRTRTCLMTEIRVILPMDQVRMGRAHILILTTTTHIRTCLLERQCRWECQRNRQCSRGLLRCIHSMPNIHSIRSRCSRCSRCSRYSRCSSNNKGSRWIQTIRCMES